MLRTMFVKKPSVVIKNSISVADFLTHAELLVKITPNRFVDEKFFTEKSLELDAFLKKLLHSGKFSLEKWMMEKGLFGGARLCETHGNLPMKLMLMSSTIDSGNTNSFKWWCPTCAVMMPVEYGSFFSKWKQDHFSVLRAIYHWCCNTDIKVVIKELCGNKTFVHSVYTELREICTKQSSTWKIGGLGHTVEIAQMNLGSCNGTTIVRLYCAFDRVTRSVRLGASKDGMKEQLDVLLNYFIEKDSYIVGDPLIASIVNARFRKNFVSTSNSIINSNAMTYLRDIVLPIFKNSKNFLKLDSIYALLNELTWREEYCTDPEKAFNSMITHIKQTCFSSVVTPKGADSAVPITMASGLSVVDTTDLIKNRSNAERLDGPELPSTSVVVLKSDGNNITNPFLAQNAKKSSLAVKRPVMATVTPSKRTKTEFINVTGTTTPLERYYYATKEGEDVRNKEMEPGKFKCQPCKKYLEDNIKMMKHITDHINSSKQFNLDLSDLTHCKYCYREFASPFAMQSHVEKVHGNEPSSLVCRICDKEFESITLLDEHMKSTHKASEMPYGCKVCKYRTSFYRDVIDHFHKMHDKTDKLMCKYCLKVFTIPFRQQEGLTHTFYRHLFAHQSKQKNRRCKSCCLAFLSRRDLRRHRTDDHVSFNNITSVKHNSISSTAIAKAVYLNIEESSENGSNSKDERQFLCVECKLPMNKANHFVHLLKCSLCAFKTCCSRGIADHAIEFHSYPPRLRPVILNSIGIEMRCPCGVLYQCGDKMAKHLALCDYKTCHFTSIDCDDTDALDVTACLELSTTALDDDGDTNKQEDESKRNDTVRNDDQHNMMNVLGLMRVKPQCEGRLSSDSRPSSITRSTSSDNSTDQ